MPVVKNRWNYETELAKDAALSNPLINRTEVNEDPSLTVQGESMTIQDLMKRARSGMPQHEFAPVDYIDVDDIDKINHFYRQGLDLTDLDDFQSRVVELAETVQRGIDDVNAAKAEKEAEDAKIAAMKEAEAAASSDPEPDQNDGGA